MWDISANASGKLAPWLGAKAIVLLVNILLPLSAMAAVAKPVAGHTVKIMPLGDSLTAGDGATGAQSYRGHLYRQLTSAGYAVDFVGSESSPTAAGGDPDHEGHGGFTIGPDQNRYCSSYPTCDPYAFNVSDHLDEWLAASSPDVITLLLGINDMFTGTLTTGQSGLNKPGVNPSDAAGKLSALVTKIKIRLPNAKIVVGSLLPVGWTSDMGADYDAVNTMAASLGSASPTDNVFFADLHATPLQPADFTDQLHLTDSGAAKIATAWFFTIQPILATLRGGADTKTVAGAPVSTATGTTAASVKQTPALRPSRRGPVRGRLRPR